MLLCGTAVCIYVCKHLATHIYQILVYTQVHTNMLLNAGKWKTLKCGNRNTETEVRKPKYGSEKKSRLLMSSALLTHDCAL